MPVSVSPATEIPEAALLKTLQSTRLMLLSIHLPWYREVGSVQQLGQLIMQLHGNRGGQRDSMSIAREQSEPILVLRDDGHMGVGVHVGCHIQGPFQANVLDSVSR